MMVSKKFKANFDALLGELSALGYQHEWGILNAADCGVAQSRKRCFVISKLGAPAPKLPEPIPLTTRLRDYLEPEPVAPEYYLSEDRLKGLIWSNEKEAQAGRGFQRFAITHSMHNFIHTTAARVSSVVVRISLHSMNFFHNPLLYVLMYVLSYGYQLNERGLK